MVDSRTPASGPGQDQRKLKRRHLVYYLNVLDTRTGQTLGQLADITTEGLMLVTREPLPQESTFTLELRVPRADGSEEAARFKARSLWCRKDVNPDLFATGFKIVQASKKAQAVIETAIAELGFQD